jgi:hypothetical protein
MSETMSKINIENISGLTSGMPLKFSGGQSISASDFKIFVFINLAVTSILSSMIVSIIRKGNIKSGLKLIPIFLIISVVLFLIASVILTSVFKGISL